LFETSASNAPAINKQFIHDHQRASGRCARRANGNAERERPNAPRTLSRVVFVFRFSFAFRRTSSDDRRSFVVLVVFVMNTRIGIEMDGLML
jgi:hypothetical protein